MNRMSDVRGRKGPGVGEGRDRTPTRRALRRHGSDGLGRFCCGRWLRFRGGFFLRCGRHERSAAKYKQDLRQRECWLQIISVLFLKAPRELAVVQFNVSRPAGRTGERRARGEELRHERLKLGLAGPLGQANSLRHRQPG